MIQGEANATGDASEVLRIAAAPARRTRWNERIVLWLACVVVGWFYLWTVRSSGEEWRWGQEQDDYYNLLIDGWLEGHLHMKRAVPPALLELKDPYDPEQRPPGLALHDASLYRGRYYVYFGAAPVVVLMLPARLLTGVDLPLAVAVLAFVYGGFLASVATWQAVRRRYFRETGAAILVAGVLALGLVGLGPVLLRRTHMWELPIGAGYCFAMLTLYAVFRSLHSERRSAWFAGAGLCLGLAIASRPTYLIASPFLAVPLLWWWRADRRLPWRTAASAVVPLAIVGALMALHNYLRFDHPLQFGQAYQLSLDYESKMAHFRATHAPFNVWRYFFSPAQWSWNFPYIQPATLPPKPPGFGGHNDVFGVLINLPLAWLALAAPLAAWRREPGECGPLLTWLGATTVLFLAMAAVLCSFFGSLSRYQMDFTPTLVLLAAVGLLALERRLRAAGGLRWAGRALWGTALVFSAGFAVLYSFELDQLFIERNPALYRDVARRFGRISYLAERAIGGGLGPVEITLRLAPRPAGTQETLLATGHAPAENRVFVRHLADGRVQLGCEGATGALHSSRALMADPTKTHRVRIAMGALYPPETHPYFADVAPAEISQRSRRLRIDWDGERVIDAFLRVPEPTRGHVRIGRAAGAGENAFSGEIVSVKRGEGGGLSAAERRGDFARLWVELPTDERESRTVLLAAGDASIYLRSLGGQRAVIGSSVSAVTDVESEPFVHEPGAVAAVEVRLDSVDEPGARRAAVVWVDGTLRWAQNIPWPAGAAAVATANTQGANGARILAVQHAEDGTDPLLQRPGPVALRVALPTGRPAGTREPLLVAGWRGAGDVVFIEYLDAQRVRFGFDHWGAVLLLSEPLALDYAKPHELEINLGAGAEPADPLAAQPLRLANLGLKVDGQRVWEVQTLFYNSAREELVLGRNVIGASTCGERFTGRILGAERVVHD